MCERRVAACERVYCDFSGPNLNYRGAVTYGGNYLHGGLINVKHNPVGVSVPSMVVPTIMFLIAYIPDFDFYSFSRATLLEQRRNWRVFLRECELSTIHPCYSSAVAQRSLPLSLRLFGRIRSSW